MSYATHLRSALSGSPGRVDLSFMDSATYQDIGPSAQIDITFGTSGTVTETAVNLTSGSPVLIDNWLISGANNGLFEILFSFNSGNPPGGSTFDTWLTLDSDRVIYLGGDPATASVTAAIRYNGGDILTTATFTMASAYE